MSSRPGPRTTHSWRPTYFDVDFDKSTNPYSFADQIRARKVNLAYILIPRQRWDDRGQTITRHYHDVTQDTREEVEDRNDDDDEEQKEKEEKGVL